MSWNGQHGEHLEDVCMTAMPDVVERLRLGGRVAERGSHVGRSSIDLRREFPRALVDAVSENQADLDAASSEASRAGLAGRVVFHVAPPDEAPLAGPYDLVVGFDGREDFAHSLRTLRRLQHLAAAG